LFIRVNCLFDIFACMNQIHAGMLRGVGDARAPMYIMLFSFVVFRQLYLLIITHITDSIIAVSFGYPIGWLMCTTLLRLYYSYSGWERRVKKPEPHHAALAHE
jgi:Na+-driven multidrug efflux pump